MQPSALRRTGLRASAKGSAIDGAFRNVALHQRPAAASRSRRAGRGRGRQTARCRRRRRSSRRRDRPACMSNAAADKHREAGRDRSHSRRRCRRSSAVSLSWNSLWIRRGSRNGRDVPTAMRLTAPSTRKSSSCSGRAPSPRRSRSVFKVAASIADQPLDVLGQRRSARRSARSTESGGTGRRGDIASSRRPSAWSRRSSSSPAEAAGQRRARRRHDGADRAQADAFQAVAGRAGSRRSAASGKGASSASSSPPADRCGRRRTAPPPRQRPASRRGRRGRRSPDGRSATACRRSMALLAAEQMGAAGDVEKQAVGCRPAPPAACSGRTSRRGLRAAGGRPPDRPRRHRSTDAWRARRRCPCRASASAPQPARRAPRCAGCCCRDG